MPLTDFEHAALDFMGNAAEPTWMFLAEMPELGADRAGLERLLGGLERRGLVSRTRELSGNPDPDAPELDDWWALTPMGRKVMRDSWD
jgi:hypothetical protein